MIRCATHLLTAVLILTGCSPALNWREVRTDTGELKALLPCKPDQGSRKQRLAEMDVDVHMMGCEAKEALFAVSYAELGAGAAVLAAQVQWQANMLQNMKAVGVTSDTYSIRGSDAQLPLRRLSTMGRRPDGRAVAAQAVWFSRGARIYHAVIYAERISDEMSDPFFSGIEFQ